MVYAPQRRHAVSLVSLTNVYHVYGYLTDIPVHKYRQYAKLHSIPLLAKHPHLSRPGPYTKPNYQFAHHTSWAFTLWFGLYAHFYEYNGGSTAQCGFHDGYEWRQGYHTGFRRSMSVDSSGRFMGMSS